MQFQWEGKQFIIQSIREGRLSTAAPHTNSSCFAIRLLATSKETEQIAALPSDLQQLLERFHEVFDEPRGLPPTRQFDHHIPLIPEAPPANVCPYRYPVLQKDEIERTVREMLTSGIIRHSTSAFSSQSS